MTKEKENVVIVDGRSVPIAGERNLLELCRKAGIEIPTFCYHSRLSVYGACRLCLVSVEGRGIVTSCSTAPEAGMKVTTTTEEIREMRRIALELLLANHDQSCPTCSKSNRCELQSLARRLGVTKVRFKSSHTPQPVDYSNPSIVRDPNKCVLCGDCVRVCEEIQGIGAIDFSGRGSTSAVKPAFGRDLGTVECVNCGQCAAVCPTGALMPKSEVEDVWKAIDDPNTIVVAQIAPAVRVGIGELFGQKAGGIHTGQIVSALRMIGFDHVYDTSYAADVTVLEEAEEFIARKVKGEKLPQFTSCCPGWVKFVEQYYPDMLENLSSCKSPQQMFGSLAKDVLPKELGVDRKKLVVVSIMPCTAKKFEAKRPEFYTDGVPDVDHVITTQELARMIEEKGLDFDHLRPESLDMPFGFKTGAGVIFGVTGGVTEAALRYAVEKLNGETLDNVEFEEVRGLDGIREATLTAGGVTVKVAMVHSLSNARKVLEDVRAGKCPYDFIEVMACPGGCVAGAGQPATRDEAVACARAEGLYDADRQLQLHKSQDNHLVKECYEKSLGDIGGKKAHHLLHTHYHSRKRMEDDGVSLLAGGADRLPVSVCVGTCCYIKGSQTLLNRLVHHVEDHGLQDAVDVRATFCFEKCKGAPNVRVGEDVIGGATLEQVVQLMEKKIAATAKK